MVTSNPQAQHLCSKMHQEQPVVGQRCRYFPADSFLPNSASSFVSHLSLPFPHHNHSLLFYTPVKTDLKITESNFIFIFSKPFTKEKIIIKKMPRVLPNCSTKSQCCKHRTRKPVLQGHISCVKTRMEQQQFHCWLKLCVL